MSILKISNIFYEGAGRNHRGEENKLPRLDQTQKFMNKA